MELKAFQEKNKKKNFFIVGSILFVLLITVVVVMKTYAIYQQRKEYDVIEGSVPEFMDNFDVKVALTIDGVPSTTFPEKGSDKAVDSIICNKGATATWDYDNWKINVANLTETKTKCQVNFVTRYVDNILNGNDPVLGKEMIPVNIADNGSVTRADMKTSWYDYSQKKWANAVILKDDNANPAEGATITEDEIESYFVWIPKFDYQIFSTTNYEMLDGINESYDASKKAIQIRFRMQSTVNNDSECVTPNESGVLGSCTVGKWMTHPAFVDGFEGKKGMWIGKFEPSHNSSNDSNEINPDALQIKPNAISWRDIQVANAFYSVYNYKRDLDSHMMKNTEWGAVAYFTHSIYGRCTSLTSCEEVRINNHSDYVTGYASVNAPTCGDNGDNLDCNKYGTDEETTQAWNTTVGYLASTTGNISGIYDIAGGSWEYVMGVLKSKEGKLISGRVSANNLHSNFNGVFTTPIGTQDTFTTGVDYPKDNKYYDLYNYAENDENYGRMILGDATGEMGPFGNAVYGIQTRRISSWFADGAWAVFYDKPWISRGGSAMDGGGTTAGVFAFSRWHGNTTGNLSFRVVLSI